MTKKFPHKKGRERERRREKRGCVIFFPFFLASGSAGVNGTSCLTHSLSLFLLRNRQPSVMAVAAAAVAAREPSKICDKKNPGKKKVFVESTLTKLSCRNRCGMNKLHFTRLSKPAPSHFFFLKRIFTFLSRSPTQPTTHS